MNPTPEKKVARDDLCRSVSFVTRDEGEPNDGFTLDGYGAVFNSPTRIDSWEGCFDELIAPGAFKKSLRERTPRMQFDHGSHPLIGSIPIGRFEKVEEDAKGLHVVGRLTDNWLIQPVRDAIREGGIDGMSFRFSVVKEEWRDNDGKVVKTEDELWELLLDGMRTGEAKLSRTLKEVRMTEVGPVVWPAYQDTEVGVRSQKITIDLGNRESLARGAFLIDAAVRETSEKANMAKSEEIVPPVSVTQELTGTFSTGASGIRFETDAVATGTITSNTIVEGALKASDIVSRSIDAATEEEPPVTEERAESDSPEPTPTPSDAAGHSPVSPAGRRRAMIDKRMALREVIQSIKPLNEKE